MHSGRAASRASKHARADSHLRLSHPSFPLEACYLVFCRGSLWAALPDKPINGHKPFQAFPGSLVTMLTEGKDNPGFWG